VQSSDGAPHVKFGSRDRNRAVLVPAIEKKSGKEERKSGSPQLRCCSLPGSAECDTAIRLICESTDQIHVPFSSPLVPFSSPFSSPSRPPSSRLVPASTLPRHATVVHCLFNESLPCEGVGLHPPYSVAAAQEGSSLASRDALKSYFEVLGALKNIVIRNSRCCKEMTIMTMFLGVSSSDVCD
jgi:hypothetical protein